MSEKKVFGISIGGKKNATVETKKVTMEERAAYTYTPTVPLLNVIPKSVLEKYQVKGIVRKFVLAGIGVVALLGLGFAGGNLLLAGQASKLNEIQSEQAALQAEATTLQPYATYRTAVDAKRTALQAATAEDVNMGTVYSNINDSATSNRVDLNNITVTQYESGQPSNDCVNSDPFETVVSKYAVIGCITFQGAADNKDQVNGFLDDLVNINGAPSEVYRNKFINTYTSNPVTQGDARTASFTASISFTSALFSNQYKDLEVSLTELIEAGVDSSESDVTDEQEVVEEVEIPEAGLVGEYVRTLIADLNDGNARSLDTLAFAACSAQEFQQSGEAIRNLITEEHPDADAESISADIITFITGNCEAIIAEQQETNN